MNSLAQNILEGVQYIDSLLEKEENCTTDNTRHVYYRIELYESQGLVSVLKPNERFFKDDTKFKNDNISSHYHWCDSNGVWHNYIRIEGPQITASKVQLFVEKLYNYSRIHNVTCIGLKASAGKLVRQKLSTLSDNAKSSNAVRSRRFLVVGRIDPSKTNLKNDALVISPQVFVAGKKILPNLLRNECQIIINQCPSQPDIHGCLDGYLICESESTIPHILQPLLTYLRNEGHNTLADAVRLSIAKKKEVDDLSACMTKICYRNWCNHWRKQVEEGILTEDEFIIKTQLHQASTEYKRLRVFNMTPQKEKCTLKQLERKLDDSDLELAVWDAIDKSRMNEITEDVANKRIDYVVKRFKNKYQITMSTRRFVQFWNYRERIDDDPLAD